MSLIATIVTKARVLLQDEGPTYRYSDALLLGYSNEAMQQAISLRPDLVFGSYSTAWSDKALGDTFPFASGYESCIADYVVFRANAVNNEESSAALAAGFMQLFEKALR